MPRKVCDCRGGSKDAISRYSKLKTALDNDLFNQNWEVVDTVKLKDRGIDREYNFVDLFSGAGGISLGFKNANFKKLMSVEIDPDASGTIAKNFPESEHFNREIEKVTDKEILEAVGGNEVHVVCGGPPCNGFSVAGLRKPEDPRNQLFHQFVRFVKLLEPSYVMMENVPGILTMSKGRVKCEILHQFKDAGYNGMSVRILEAANFGVPQLRTRAIFIANKHGLRNPYPKEIFDRENYIAIESAISDLMDVGRSPDINHEWTEHTKNFEERISKVKPGESLYESYRDAFKRQHLGVPSMTIKENHGGTHIHPILNRVISAREMARLQTFPDEFIFAGRMKRVMWQVGNAVPVLLSEHIALALRERLNYLSEKGMLSHGSNDREPANPKSCPA
jgi:DNA (cytosine-5)-methyltransferase 1